MTDGGPDASGPRLERARAALDAAGAAGLLVTPGVAFAWLAGPTIERTERLVLLGLPRAGDPWLVCPAFEAGRLAEEVPDAEVLPWEESEDPFALAAGSLAGSSDPWLVEPSTAFHDVARLAAAAPDVPLVDGADVFADLRRPKDAAEIAALRRAIDAAWDVLAAVVPDLADGVSEAEVAAALEGAFAARDHDGWALVQFGEGSAVPHGEPGGRRLARGTPVLVDWGGWKDGFTADLTRSFWWDGAPVPPADAPAAYRRVHEVVRRAQAAALRTAGPGVPCGAVDAAARDVIREAGHGERFTHRLGHGLGREIHEAPYLVGGSDDVLRPGDVVTVEPGIYLPGRFGVRWEDDVLVTVDGVEVLSARPEEPVPS